MWTLIKLGVAVAATALSIKFGMMAVTSPGTEITARTAVVTHKMIVPDGNNRADLVLVYRTADNQVGSLDVDKVSYALRGIGDQIVVKKEDMVWTHNQAQQDHKSTLITWMFLCGLLAFFALVTLIEF